MTLSADVRLLVRERADYACEYCTVTETDSGGELTIDHYHPPSKGGSFDDLENLLYCCQRCNNYKSDYWARRSADLPLWNPRDERREQHMVVLENGTVYPIHRLAHSLFSDFDSTALHSSHIGYAEYKQPQRRDYLQNYANFSCSKSDYKINMHD